MKASAWPRAPFIPKKPSTGKTVAGSLSAATAPLLAARSASGSCATATSIAAPLVWFTQAQVSPLSRAISAALVPSAGSKPSFSEKLGL